MVLDADEHAAVPDGEEIAVTTCDLLEKLYLAAPCAT